MHSYTLAMNSQKMKLRKQVQRTHGLLRKKTGSQAGGRQAAPVQTASNKVMGSELFGTGRDQKHLSITVLQAPT